MSPNQKAKKLIFLEHKEETKTLVFMKWKKGV